MSAPVPITKQLTLHIVTGLSGSGKSVALKALEDAGCYTIDNLPANLLPALVDTLEQEPPRHVAVSIDSRTLGNLSVLAQTLTQLQARGLQLSVLFLDAALEALVQRFGESRRPHPLARSMGSQAARTETGQDELAACIEAERTLLAPLVEMAFRIDTSRLSSLKLRAIVTDWLGLDTERFTLTIQSFGFKNGSPRDADFVFDARFLANPFYDPVLRPMSGLDEPVQQFLAQQSSAADFIARVAELLRQVLPQFPADGRVSLSVAIGCTGGQHRSVYIAEQLAAALSTDYQTLVRHRDMLPYSPPSPPMPANAI